MALSGPRPICVGCSRESRRAEARPHGGVARADPLLPPLPLGAEAGADLSVLADVFGVRARSDPATRADRRPGHLTVRRSAIRRRWCIPVLSAAMGWPLARWQRRIQWRRASWLHYNACFWVRWLVGRLQAPRCAKMAHCLFASVLPFPRYPPCPHHASSICRPP